MPNLQELFYMFQTFILSIWLGLYLPWCLCTEQDLYVVLSPPTHNRYRHKYMAPQKWTKMHYVLYKASCMWASVDDRYTEHQRYIYIYSTAMTSYISFRFANTNSVFSAHRSSTIQYTSRYNTIELIHSTKCTSSEWAPLSPIRGVYFRILFVFSYKFNIIMILIIKDEDCGKYSQRKKQLLVDVSLTPVVHLSQLWHSECH